MKEIVQAKLKKKKEERGGGGGWVNACIIGAKQKSR